MNYLGPFHEGIVLTVLDDQWAGDSTGWWVMQCWLLLVHADVAAPWRMTILSDQWPRVGTV